METTKFIIKTVDIYQKLRIANIWANTIIVKMR